MAGFNKVVNTFEEAMAGLEDDMTIIAGGFGICGVQQGLIEQIKKMGVKGLTIASNNCGLQDYGLGILLEKQQIKKMIASYVGENALFEKQLMEGTLEVDLTPQGTLAEKMRAGGAGIPAFYTATGYGTDIAKGKETKEFNGRMYVMEESLTGDFALVRAWKADTFGNLIYHNTQRNFNPMAATAGKITVVEADIIVEAGELDPADIHTPGVYVDRLIQTQHEKVIEFRTTREA
ncbi:MAG: CoA transferase subunit A [Agarilytica sp.]